MKKELILIYFIWTRVSIFMSVFVEWTINNLSCIYTYIEQ